MKGVAIGRIDGIESYVSQKTGATVWNISVASKGTMLNVRTPDGADFSEDEVVFVVGAYRGGKLGSIYVRGGVVIRPTEEELAMFQRLTAAADVVAAVEEETEG